MQLSLPGMSLRQHDGVRQTLSLIPPSLNLGLALAHQFYVALKAQGHGRLGTQALQLAFEQMNNMEVKVNNGANK